MSWPFMVLLALAVALVVAAEWERLGSAVGGGGRRARRRARGKPKLTLVQQEPETDIEEFAASVQRDLEQLPTIEEHDHR